MFINIQQPTRRERTCKMALVTFGQNTCSVSEISTLDLDVFRQIDSALMHSQHKPAELQTHISLI